MYFFIRLDSEDALETNISFTVYITNKNVGPSTASPNDLQGLHFYEDYCFSLRLNTLLLHNITQGRQR